MKTGSKLATVTVAAGLAVAGIAGPAHAAVTGATTATFTITGGELAITVPGSPVALATVSTGTLVATGQLGDVTVVDTRGVLLNGWTTTVATTAFVTGTSTPNETVPAPSVGYASGLATAHTGLGVFVPGTIAAPPNHTAGGGNSSTTWNPTLTMTLLSSQVAGGLATTVPRGRKASGCSRRLQF